MLFELHTYMCLDMVLVRLSGLVACPRFSIISPQTSIEPFFATKLARKFKVDTYHPNASMIPDDIYKFNYNLVIKSTRCVLDSGVLKKQRKNLAVNTIIEN